MEKHKFEFTIVLELNKKQLKKIQDIKDESEKAIVSAKKSPLGSDSEELIQIINAKSAALILDFITPLFKKSINKNFQKLCAKSLLSMAKIIKEAIQNNSSNQVLEPTEKNG